MFMRRLIPVFLVLAMLVPGAFADLKLGAPAEVELKVGGLAKTLTVDNPGRKPVAIVNPNDTVVGFWEIVSRDPNKQVFLVQGIQAGRFTLFVLVNGATPDLPPEEAARITVTVKSSTDPPPPHPPVPGTGDLHFLIIRPDGPANPAFTAAMSDPNWITLRKTYTVKDKTSSEAKELNIILPGTPLPCVVTLRSKPGDAFSDIVRGAIPLPAGDAILKLPEGLK